METKNVSFASAKNLNRQVNEFKKTLNGVVSQILTLDKNGVEKQQKDIINFLVLTKKKTEQGAQAYKQLKETAKPSKKGNYNSYNIILSVRRILNEQK